jgi:16S rRNA (uracil1498-N3)-methyltransferase
MEQKHKGVSESDKLTPFSVIIFCVLLFTFDFMSLPIFFIDKPATSDFITLNEDTSKHVVQVLRMNTGDALQLSDGLGNLLTAEVVDPHKKKCSVRIINRTFKERKEQRISIAISLLKNASRLEWFLEKATELGVTEIIPMLCDRTEKQHFRYERMQQIVVSAMMQSQQVWLPVLHQPVAYKDVVIKSNYTEKLIAHCEDDDKVNITDIEKTNSVQVLIGPEGDFTSTEINIAFEHQFKPISVGHTRLRTETAGVAAASIFCIK